ncbi:MAG: hypothetical protein WCO82_09745, partial [Sphingomonadales bacterium]
MCASMAGDDLSAAAAFDRMRARRSGVARFDQRLAQRIATLAGDKARASGVNWEEAPQLTLFRYGVASAAGVPVPAAALATLGPAAPGWIVRNPNLAAADRLAASRAAAELGTLGSADLVAAVAALAPVDASGGFADNSRAARLRTAFIAGRWSERAAAIAGIRADGGYGALLESALPAQQLPPRASFAADSADIIASLLAIGNQTRALAWWPVAQGAEKPVAARAWALLAVGAGGVPINPRRFRQWRDDVGATPAQAQRLLALLQGLGLTNGADWASLRTELQTPPRAPRWELAITTASRRGAAGEVALLALTGMQGRMADVPARHLAAITAAMKASGQGFAAHMLAAEAMTRG